MYEFGLVPKLMYSYKSCVVMEDLKKKIALEKTKKVYTEWIKLKVKQLETIRR